MTTEALWVGIGFFGQALFFGRWVVQWLASERNAESRVPVSFWYMSLIGVGTFVYVRNLILIHRADQTKSQSTPQT